jgi:hypothetical protein
MTGNPHSPFTSRTFFAERGNSQLELPATICGNWLLASDGLTERDWLQKQKTTSIKEPHLRTGRLKMSNYRAYIVGLDGHFETFHVIDADDDDTAVKTAQMLGNGQEVEVWYLDRKVAVLPRKK